METYQRPFKHTIWYWERNLVIVWFLKREARCIRIWRNIRGPLMILVRQSSLIRCRPIFITIAGFPWLSWIELSRLSKISLGRFNLAPSPPCCIVDLASPTRSRNTTKNLYSTSTRPWTSEKTISNISYREAISISSSTNMTKPFRIYRPPILSSRTMLWCCISGELCTS